MIPVYPSGIMGSAFNSSQIPHCPLDSWINIPKTVLCLCAPFVFHLQSWIKIISDEGDTEMRPLGVLFLSIYMNSIIGWSQILSPWGQKISKKIETRSSAEATAVQSPPPLSLVSASDQIANLPYVYTVFGPNGLWSPSVGGGVRGKIFVWTTKWLPCRN